MLWQVTLLCALGEQAPWETQNPAGPHKNRCWPRPGKGKSTRIVHTTRTVKTRAEHFGYNANIYANNTTSASKILTTILKVFDYTIYTPRYLIFLPVRWGGFCHSRSPYVWKLRNVNKIMLVPECHWFKPRSGVPWQYNRHHYPVIQVRCTTTTTMNNLVFLSNWLWQLCPTRCMKLETHHQEEDQYHSNSQTNIRPLRTTNVWPCIGTLHIYTTTGLGPRTKRNGWCIPFLGVYANFCILGQSACTPRVIYTSHFLIF